MSKPWDTEADGVVSEFCYEGRQLFLVSVDIQLNFYRLCDIPGVDGATVDYLKAARFL